MHKGKSKQKLDNYRGIAIGSNFGKVFCRVVRARLQEVAEVRGLLGEKMQNGFRKGRSTSDNLFILSRIIDNVLRTGRKEKGVCMVFIYLRKAYDRVWREGLWRVLEDSALDRKLVNIIKRVYKGHRRRVVTIGGLTDLLHCTIGMKQGCVLSPILFAVCSRFITQTEDRKHGDKNWKSVYGWLIVCR